MGNPQERLIWLAGFIDGEGYLGIHRVPRHRASGYQLTARVVITNTSDAALKAIEALLNECHLTYAVRFPKVDKPHWRPQWQLEVSGIKPVLRLLNLVSPHLIVKTTQAELLSEFCNRRLKRFKALYSAVDLADWQGLKELNQNPQRLDARVLKEAQDIVRASVRAEEAGRNGQPSLF